MVILSIQQYVLLNFILFRQWRFYLFSHYANNKHTYPYGLLGSSGTSWVDIDVLKTCVLVMLMLFGSLSTGRSKDYI
jgi:hypothetical protein